jgi:uncharacterized protein YkwD
MFSLRWPSHWQLIRDMKSTASLFPRLFFRRSLFHRLSDRLSDRLFGRLLRTVAVTVVHVVAAAVVALPLLAILGGTCAAQDNRSYFSSQSSDDPNRPPQAQGSLRRNSQPAATPTPQEQSSAAPTGAEKLLFDQLNESRVLAGLPALRWDGNLAAAARKHCALMVQHDTLSHQFPGEIQLQQRLHAAGVEFSIAAENVAMAPTAEEVHYEWMHSPPHRANILDPQLTAVGIATLPGNKGLYAVQDFALAFETMALSDQEAKIRALIEASGLRTADNPQRTQWSDARKTCQLASGYAGQPASVVRFESSDLNKLPAGLQKSLASGKYHTAAVGACTPPSDGTGFTHFRFAVLLFF